MNNPSCVQTLKGGGGNYNKLEWESEIGRVILLEGEPRPIILYQLRYEPTRKAPSICMKLVVVNQEKVHKNNDTQKNYRTFLHTLNIYLLMNLNF